MDSKTSVSMLQTKRAELSDLIQFVPAQMRNEKKENKNLEKKVNGTEIKLFYEKLVNGNERCDTESFQIKSGDTKTKGKETKSGKKQVQQSSSKTESLNANAFLKYANHGNRRGVHMCLRDGVDINSCDSFGWSALMCCAYDGHKDIAEFLLEQGIDSRITDRLGRDAVNLATSHGHLDIAGMIEKYRTFSYHERMEKSSSKRNAEEFYCSVCKSDFKDGNRKSHESSTVHLFNLRLKPKQDRYLIPPSNVGYRLMMKNGWDGEKGLGPDGQGPRYPVRTVLKRDRSCLGAEKNHRKKAKVTHFAANDTEAVKSSIHVCRKKSERKESIRTLGKRAKKEKSRNDKKWERNLRQYMNCD